MEKLDLNLIADFKYDDWCYVTDPYQEFYSKIVKIIINMPRKILRGSQICTAAGGGLEEGQEEKEQEQVMEQEEQHEELVKEQEEVQED